MSRASEKEGRRGRAPGRSSRAGPCTQGWREPPAGVSSGLGFQSSGHTPGSPLSSQALTAAQGAVGFKFVLVIVLFIKIKF